MIKRYPALGARVEPHGQARGTLNRPHFVGRHAEPPRVNPWHLRGVAYERCPAHEEEANALARLIAVIGPDRFHKVQELFGGERVWIPKPGAEQPCRRCPDRDRRLHDLRRRGAPVSVLAEQFGLSPKRVYGILREASANGRRASPSRR